MLIVLEGLDNAGKTTIANRLKEDLEKRGYDVEYTREFETIIGKLILQMGEKGELDPIIKSYLFACDRHIRLKPYLETDVESKVILFDRFTPSAIAYRMAEGVERLWVETINSVFPSADLVYYINITAEESIRRRTPKKSDLGYSEADLRKVRNAYMDICDDYNMIQIDGMRPVDDVYREILKDVLKKIKR